MTRFSEAELKPDIPAETLEQIFSWAPDAERRIRHGLLAGIGANPALVNDIGILAQYRWQQGELYAAKQLLGELVGIFSKAYGDYNAATILAKARLEAVQGELAEEREVLTSGKETE